ncbi:MAG: DUF3592 domain-containing protein [Clostridiales bacterium]|uniref:DUF3592 domain-containing protein n=1 Tax=Clostridium sp. N3C TaxID=1776758 RepID=UPI00092DF543|nr:DUF3592 domain-containing protein [Clostridium sp. N3C]NLZ48068.1 DUF3592 domain-containing protein [Clostridiales bacterium]SCN23248.1 hypothetical protein N3C_1205 [Clostridium sp. N3C]
MKIIDPIKAFVIFVSSFLIIYGLFKFAQVISFIRNSEVTAGEIIGYDIILERHDGWRNYKYPKVSFTVKETGEKVVGTSIYPDKKEKSKLGEKVTFRYNKSNPREVLIDSIENIWYVPITSVAGGFFIFFVYLLSRLFRYKNYMIQ